MEKNQLVGEGAKVIQANTRLKQLVGVGAVNTQTVEKMKKAIDENKIDFATATSIEDN